MVALTSVLLRKSNILLRFTDMQKGICCRCPDRKFIATIFFIMGKINDQLNQAFKHVYIIALS